MSSKPSTKQKPMDNVSLEVSDENFHIPDLHHTDQDPLNKSLYERISDLIKEEESERISRLAQVSSFRRKLSF